MVYDVPPSNDALSQADILDGCPLFGLEADSESVDLDTAPTRWHERVVVLTQACDLAQTKATKVVVAVVHQATTH